MTCQRSSSAHRDQTCQLTWAPHLSRSVRSPRPLAARQHQVENVLVAGALRLSELLLAARSGEPLDLASRILFCRK